MSDPLKKALKASRRRTGDRTDVSSSLLPSLSHSTGLRIANINYRLSPAVTHPSHIQDLASALLTLPSSSHLILMGHSCGSFLISSLLFDHRHDKVTEALRSRIIGFIASEPIFDPADLLDEYPDYREFLKGAFGSEEAVRTQGAETNRWSGKGELKVLVSHTREDELLSLRQPIGLVQKLWSWSGKEGQWSDEERSFEGNGLNVEVDFYSVHGTFWPLIYRTVMSTIAQASTTISYSKRSCPLKSRPGSNATIFPQSRRQRSHTLVFPYLHREEN